MITAGRVVGLIQAMGGGADPAVIEAAVQDWLDDHPEATTTVADGSITEQKLATSIAQKLGLISSLSDEIDDIGSDVTDLKSAISDIETVTGFYVEPGKNLFNNQAILDAYNNEEYTSVSGYSVVAIQLKPNTKYYVTCYTPGATAAGFVSSNESVASSYGAAVSIGTTEWSRARVLTTDATGKLYVGSNNITGFKTDILSIQAQIEEGETQTPYEPFEAVPHSDVEENKAALSVINNQTTPKAEKGLVWTSTSNGAGFLPINTNNSKNIPMFLDFAADVNWISQNDVPLWNGAVIERLADGSTDCNNPYFIVSGNAGDSYVTVESGGNALISDIPTDKNWGAVISIDGIAYKTCNAQYRDANTIEVYPPLTETFSNGVLAYNCVGIHLTKRGYFAYCQKAMSLNPKWCEKSGVIASYRVGDTVPWTKFGGLMSADVTNSNIGMNFVNKYYQQVFSLSFYNGWTSHQTPSGIEWDVDLSGKSGYMELIVGGFNDSYIDYPTGQEFHIELYLDGELSYSYVKSTQICERLCADIDEANAAKLKIYSNKWSAVDGVTYGLSISQITFWENKNEYETNEPLIKPFATIAQMFDSWGVFHNGITATELARLHRLQGNNIYVPYENHSLGNQTSAWGCGWFYENVWKYHPATMFVDFSINDKNSTTTTGWPTTVVGSDGTVYSNIITQSDYIRNMSDLCNMAISNGIQPVVFGSYLIGTCDYFQALCYAWASQQ